VPLPPPLAAARESLALIGEHLAGIPDGALERPWAWTGESRSDVRSAIYLAAMELQAAAGRMTRTLAAAGLAGGPAAGALAAVTQARWDLHGVLAPLGDATLDTDPGGGEWTVRETLGHIIDSQRAYAWFSAWWLGRADEPDLPAQADEAHGLPLPSERAQREGTLDHLRARLDALVDLSAWLWEPADEAALATPARWSGFRVDVGFRTHRWAAHLAEHTIQVDKTLALLGRAPTEVKRLHRHLYRAYGDLEGTVFGHSWAALERAGQDAPVGAALAEALERTATLVDGAAAAA
jgi:hypothetical protein